MMSNICVTLNYYNCHCNDFEHKSTKKCYKNISRFLLESSIVLIILYCEEATAMVDVQFQTKKPLQWLFIQPFFLELRKSKIIA